MPFTGLLRGLQGVPYARGEIIPGRCLKGLSWPPGPLRSDSMGPFGIVSWISAWTVVSWFVLCEQAILFVSVYAQGIEWGKLDGRRIVAQAWAQSFIFVRICLHRTVQR